MPVIGFGTWDVRGEQGKRIIMEALDSGYRLIDTAQMYDNEDIVGMSVKESGIPRKEMFLTTKLYRPCASYQKAKSGIERSLNNLQTDYIDMMLCSTTPEQEMSPLTKRWSGLWLMVRFVRLVCPTGM